MSVLLWLGSRKDHREIPQLGGELTTHMEIVSLTMHDVIAKADTTCMAVVKLHADMGASTESQ